MNADDFFTVKCSRSWRAQLFSWIINDLSSEKGELASLDIRPQLEHGNCNLDVAWRSRYQSAMHVVYQQYAALSELHVSYHIEKKKHGSHYLQIQQQVYSNHRLLWNWKDIWWLTNGRLDLLLRFSFFCSPSNIFALNACLKFYSKCFHNIILGEEL